MDIRVGDVITMKKKHPCGCDRFTVLRIGADFRIKRVPGRINADPRA